MNQGRRNRQRGQEIFKGGGPARPLLERFSEKWRSVDGECWVWIGMRNWDGYGRIKVGRKNELAHRVAFELYRSKIPSGHEVCHRCDNPSCVNPSHLFLGVHKENMHDAIAKGRLPILALNGTKNGRAKLTADQVMAIRASKESTAQLARDLGMSESGIRHIRQGSSWGHLP